MLTAAPARRPPTAGSTAAALSRGSDHERGEADDGVGNGGGDDATPTAVRAYGDTATTAARTHARAQAVARAVAVISGAAMPRGETESSAATGKCGAGTVGEAWGHAQRPSSASGRPNSAPRTAVAYSKVSRYDARANANDVAVRARVEAIRQWESPSRSQGQPQS